MTMPNLICQRIHLSLTSRRGHMKKTTAARGDCLSTMLACLMGDRHRLLNFLQADTNCER